MGHRLRNNMSKFKHAVRKLILNDKLRNNLKET